MGSSMANPEFLNVVNQIAAEADAAVPANLISIELLQETSPLFRTPARPAHAQPTA